MQKDRGLFLTVLFIISFIGIAFTIFRDLIYILAGGLNFTTMILILTVTISLAILIGIWRWKKWAVYVFFMLTGLAFVLTLIKALEIFSYYSLVKQGQYDQYRFNFIISNDLGAIGLVTFYFFIWFWAIRRKWQYFS